MKNPFKVENVGGTKIMVKARHFQTQLLEWDPHSRCFEAPKMFQFRGYWYFQEWRCKYYIPLVLRRVWMRVVTP